MLSIETTHCGKNVSSRISAFDSAAPVRVSASKPEPVGPCRRAIAESPFMTGIVMV